MCKICTLHRTYDQSIDDQRKDTAEPKEFGHWKLDTIIGKRQKSLTLHALDKWAFEQDIL